VGETAAAPDRLLGRWLSERGEAGPVELAGRATVGLSQETWFVRVGGEDAVLRLPTPASGRRAIGTQIAALRAVAGTVPAPAVLWADAGEDNPFGRPFLVMERIGGEVPVGWHALPEPLRGQLAEQAIEELADLHRLSPPRLGGERLDSPTGLDFFASRLERHEPLPPVLRGALWWLRRNRPPPTPPAFVHGDFRMGNMVVAGDRLAAVLDWEMAGGGDPLADLAWCFIPLWEPPGVEEAELLGLYGERRGEAVDPDRFLWHRVLGYVRLAYYALSGTSAFERGGSDDLRLAALRLQLPVHLDRLASTLAGRTVTI
jgi:aminoglycoside phosphotransferase (APT) family kinase protein